METPASIVVRKAMKALGVHPVILNQRRIEIPENNRHDTFANAIQHILPFNSDSNDPIRDASIFIDHITTAYKKINPIEITKLHKIIRSKIIGTATEMISDDKTNLQDLIIELKRKYPETALNWEHELVNSKQQFYENPMHFGERLKKIINYSRETNIGMLSVTLYDGTCDFKSTALKIFMDTLTNDYLRTLLKRESPTTLTRAIELAKELYSAMMHDNLENMRVIRNWEFECMYCEKEVFHYFDCPLIDTFYFVNY